MCKHNWKKINDVDVCIKCGLTVSKGRILMIDKKLVERVGKRVKA